jgi:hypothetical protein
MKNWKRFLWAIDEFIRRGLVQHPSRYVIFLRETGLERFLKLEEQVRSDNFPEIWSEQKGENRTISSFVYATT